MEQRTVIQSEQLRQMLAGSIASIVTSTLLAFILAYMQYKAVDAAVVMVWLAIVVLIALSRVALVIAYRRIPVDEFSSAHARLPRFRLGVLAAGAVWGFAGLLLFPANAPDHQMFLIFMLAGLSAGGVVSYSADLASAIGFSVLTLVPLIIRLFVEGGSFSISMGMGAVLYLAFMVISLRRINANISENIVLRLEAVAREEMVKASEERYRSLLTHLPIGILHYDTNLVVTYCNDRFAKILRNSSNRLIGLDMKILKDQSILPALSSVLKGEIGHYEGHYVATYSDADIWIDVTCAPSRDSGGKIAGGIGIIQDISDRKKTEAEVRVAATAFESQEGMLITDANNDILRVNRAFTSITGYTAEDVIGKNPRILSSGRQDAGFYSAMWNRLNTTGAWEGEIWNRRKNGEIYPEYLTISVVKDQNGAVMNYVASLADITLRKSAEEEIKSLAFYDPLTRLPNRRLLLDRLHQALASCARSGRECALLFIDLDNFKILNDTLGHDIGDLLLQQVAQRLESCVREGDTVARLGGDEFVVMLEDLSTESIEAAAQTEVIGEKILAMLSQIYQLSSNKYRCTTSIGVTLFKDHERKADELMKQADIAMYQAKKAGRNTLRFFDPQMQKSINSRAALEDELHKAIENRQLRLYYQAQVDSSDRLMGAEALIRWLHPERGLVSPTQFIPLAEETGQILSIGQWVLETACARLNVWQQDVRTRDLVLAVNVSATQLRQADFVEQVQAAIQLHAINPARLKLELTESMLLENIEDTVATMNALKIIGVQLSLDDFGTGYSSLQYLKRLPLDQLKIDQSFVHDLASDSSDSAIVYTIIAMAHSLNLDVIAEGVETDEQRQLLFDKGCVHYQGYLFGEPVSAEEFEAALKRSR